VILRVFMWNLFLISRDSFGWRFFVTLQPAKINSRMSVKGRYGICKYFNSKEIRKAGQK
jgi:hypothetical protein